MYICQASQSDQDRALSGEIAPLLAPKQADVVRVEVDAVGAVVPGGGSTSVATTSW